jgi:phosphoribosylanthranilate isomerase
MKVKIKICGITSIEDALFAVQAGATAIGFVFHRTSPRYISPARAAIISKALPKSVIKVGVFVRASSARIRSIARQCGLDMLQFHGNQSAKFCKGFSRYKVIKALRIKDSVDPLVLKSYDTFAFLFDTYVPYTAGGTGKVFNWRLLSEVQGITRPIFLSGGLTALNVRKAVMLVKPDWVDVSSSVELSPGKKDPIKVRKFIQKVKTIV